MIPSMESNSVSCVRTRRCYISIAYGVVIVIHRVGPKDVAEMARLADNLHSQ